jgi:mevalonate kinase
MGHGKVILVGEHAAVYGYPALAGALACGVALEAGVPVAPVGRRAADAFALDIDGWDLHVRGGDDHPVARALEAVARALGIEGAAVSGTADVPPAAGLGSSAALAVALTRALAGFNGKSLDLGAVEEVAAAAERCFHGNPSGIDVAVAARGGMGLYRRGQGLTPIDAKPLTLVIGLSGEPRSTAAMVQKVADARAVRTAAVDAELAALGAGAERAAVIVCAPVVDTDELGEIFTDAHARLSSLGVSAPVLDEMVAAATGAGATGAKLTGGGGGGAVIALAPGREDAVIAAWRAIGKNGFVTDVGARS